MTAARSHYCCRGCRAKLANVRGSHGARRMYPIPPVRPVYREDGCVELTCPACKQVNRFVWFAPKIRT